MNTLSVSGVEVMSQRERKSSFNSSIQKGIIEKNPHAC